MEAKKSGKGDRRPFEPQEESQAASDEDSKDEGQPLFEVVFSSDEDGSNLGNLWAACQAAELERKQAPEEVGNLDTFLEASTMRGHEEASLMGKLAEKYEHQTEFVQYFLDLYDIGTSVYTGTDSINTARESMGGGAEVNFIEPTSCFDCTGHPSDVVTYIAKNIVDLIDLSDLHDQVACEHTAFEAQYRIQFWSRRDTMGRMSSIASVTAEIPRRSAVMMAGGDQPSRVSPVIRRKMEEFQRKRMLDMLDMLSLLVLWPHNRKVMVIRLGKLFPKPSY